MQNFTLYEEVTRDGSIPDTVLAYPHGEFERKARDAGYQMVYYILRNPRKFEQAPTAAPRPRQYNFVGTAASAVPSPVENTARRLPQPAESSFKLQYNNLEDLAALLSTPTPSQRPPAAHVAAPSSSPRAERQQQQQLHQQQSARAPMPAARAFPAPSPINNPGWSHGSASQQLVAQNTPAGIPAHIWDDVKTIKSLERNRFTDLPMRVELAGLSQHFYSRGILKPDAPLRAYFGDTRLFSREWWNYFAEQTNRTGAGRRIRT